MSPQSNFTSKVPIDKVERSSLKIPPTRLFTQQSLQVHPWGGGRILLPPLQVADIVLIPGIQYGPQSTARGLSQVWPKHKNKKKKNSRFSQAPSQPGRGMGAKFGGLPQLKDVGGTAPPQAHPLPLRTQVEISPLGLSLSLAKGIGDRSGSTQTPAFLHQWGLPRSTPATPAPPLEQR